VYVSLSGPRKHQNQTKTNTTIIKYPFLCFEGAKKAFSEEEKKTCQKFRLRRVRATTKSDDTFFLCSTRVARFFWTQYTKTGKNDHKIYQMA
jgi:hypothetical protein